MLIYTIGKLRYPDINQCVYSRFFYCIHFFVNFISRSVGRSLLLLLLLLGLLFIIRKSIALFHSLVTTLNKAINLYIPHENCVVFVQRWTLNRERIFFHNFTVKRVFFSSLILVFLFFVSFRFTFFFRFSFLHLL